MPQFDRQKVIKAVLVCLCLGVMIFSGVKLGQIFTQYNTADSTYDDATEMAITELPPVSATDETEPPAYVVPFAVDFDALRQTNDDVVGWIYCEGTVINYPIMQSDNNNFYLEHLFDGSYNKTGSITLNSQNSAGFTDNHTLIYGHNMKNGSMFTTLKRYSAQEFYDEHPIMWIITPDGAYVLELLAGYVTSAESQAAFNLGISGESLTEHVNRAMSRSTFVSTAAPESVEKLVTLITCSYEYDDARYILLGSLVPVDEMNARAAADSEE